MHFILAWGPVEAGIYSTERLHRGWCLAPPVSQAGSCIRFLQSTEVRRNSLDSQVNVFLDTKSKASSFTEIPAKELILLYLQSTLQELCGFLSTHCNIARNLFIASNPKRPHSVPCCNAEISCECPVDIQSTFYYSSVFVF